MSYTVSPRQTSSIYTVERHQLMEIATYYAMNQTYSIHFCKKVHQQLKGCTSVVTLSIDYVTSYTETVFLQLGLVYPASTKAYDYLIVMVAILDCLSLQVHVDSHHG